MIEEQQRRLRWLDWSEEEGKQWYKKKKKVGETLEGLAGLCKGFGIYLEYYGKTRLQAVTREARDTYKEAVAITQVRGNSGLDQDCRYGGSEK